MRIRLRGKLLVLCLVAAMLTSLAGVALAKEKVTFWTSHSGHPDRDALELIAAQFTESQDKY